MKLALIIIGSSLGLLIGLAGTIYAASEAFDKTKTEEHTFAEPITEVVIEADAGDVEVVQGRELVQVRETRHYLADAPDMTRDIRDGVLTLESDCDGVLSFFCDTDYRVEVPRGVAVTVDTHVGDIDVDVASRDIDVRTNVGDIDIAVPKGTYAIDADTDVGDAEEDGLVSYDLAKRTIDAQTNVGDVDISAR